MNRAVFLDRDGVINRAFVRAGKSYPPARLEEFELLDGVTEACAQLKAEGFLLIVVTNQPDVGSGKQALAVVEAMHRRMLEWLPIDDVFVCFHLASDHCDCRKPLPGMLHAAAARHDIDLTSSIMVGDRWRDIEAGQAVGCQCFFIDYQYDEPGPKTPFEAVPDLRGVAERIQHLSKLETLPGGTR